MKTLCIADFDDTLILTDSLVYILKSEKWYLRPGLISAGIGIVLSKVVTVRKLKSRSAFKKQVLKYYYALSGEKKRKYTDDLRRKLNQPVIDDIKNKGFDRIVVVSASETGLIREVLSEVFADMEVIANSLTGGPEDDNFETCYGENKITRLSEVIPDYKDYEITVYTDSWSDKPLMEIANQAYIVMGERIEQALA